MKLTRKRLMEIAGLLKEQTEYTFSGTDRFMDRTAVNVFKKYGIDKTMLNREYDPNEGVVEFTVTIADSSKLQKISDELEQADRGRGDFGGYYEK